jgi:adenine deaminase
MSNNADFVQDEITRLIKNAHEMGVNTGIDPLVTLSFLSLPVIPKLRITTRGLYDAVRGKYM